MKSPTRILFGGLAAILVAGSAQASIITWSAPFYADSTKQTDVLKGGETLAGGGAEFDGTVNLYNTYFDAVTVNRGQGGTDGNNNNAPGNGSIGEWCSSSTDNNPIGYDSVINGVTFHRAVAASSRDAQNDISGFADGGLITRDKLYESNYYPSEGAGGWYGSSDQSRYFYVMDGAMGAGETGRITLNNLVSGANYQIQVWGAIHDRGGSSNFYIDGKALRNTWYADGTAGVAYLLGKFTADGTTQVLDTLSPDNGGWSAMSVFSMSPIPEPSSLLGLGCLVGAGALLRTRRRNG